MKHFASMLLMVLMTTIAVPSFAEATANKSSASQKKTGFAARVEMLEKQGVTKLGSHTIEKIAGMQQHAAMVDRRKPELSSYISCEPVRLRKKGAYGFRVVASLYEIARGRQRRARGTADIFIVDEKGAIADKTSMSLDDLCPT